MGWIMDVLQEIPLSAVQRERLALAEQKYGLLQARCAELEALAARLELTVSELQARTKALDLENENLRLDINRRDDVLKDQAFHGEVLDAVKEKILLLLAAQDGLSDAQVASAVGAGVQLATFHLNELHALKMVRCTLRVGQRETPWHISQEGRRYLVQHDLLT